MIDWLSFSLPYDGPPVGIQFLKRETWDAPIEPVYSRPVQVEGSYSAKLAVQAIGGRLYISGNPVKFFSGQNVAGTNDIRRLVRMTVEAVSQSLGLLYCPAMWDALECGNVTLSRVDSTFAYAVGTDDDVATWLEAMERACHVRYRGRGHFDARYCALSFGTGVDENGQKKASRRSTFKFYNKWRELGVHPMTCDGDTAAQLRAMMLGMVRGEACYRGLELKRLGYERLSAWDVETCWKLHREWISKMEMSEAVSLKDDVEKDLPRWLQSTYRHWIKGEDLRALLSRRTFYRQRKELLELVQIDIANPCITATDRLKVVPIIRVLEAKPVPEEELEPIFWQLVARAA